MYDCVFDWNECVCIMMYRLMISSVQDRGEARVSVDLYHLICC